MSNNLEQKLISKAFKPWKHNKSRKQPCQLNLGTQETLRIAQYDFDFSLHLSVNFPGELEEVYTEKCTKTLKKKNATIRLQCLDSIGKSTITRL